MTPAFVHSLAEDLLQSGWDTELLAPHAAGASTRDTIGTVPVRRFRYQWPAALQTLCYDGGAAVRLRRQPLNWLNVPPFVVAEIVATVRHARAMKADVINAHWILPQGLAGAIASRTCDIPLVITAHGGDVFGLRGHLATRVKRSLLNAAHVVTANSSATESALRAIAPRATFVRVPMGVDIVAPDMNRVAALERQYRDKDGPLLVFVGRLIARKGIDDLISALDLLRAQHPRLRCVIVGDGPEREVYELQAATAGLTGQLAFTGWVEPEEVLAYMAAADCFVGLSKDGPDASAEAQGLTFIEAMSVGTPVVATRSGGIADAVRHEETGLLVEQASPEAAAAAISRIISDPALARLLGENGRRVARDEFSRAQSGARMADAFNLARESHARKQK